MDLSISDIKADIAGFKDRIQTARAELSSLPEGFLEFKKHKAREKQRRDLHAEVKHVNILIGYAMEGISIREAEASK